MPILRAKVQCRGERGKPSARKQPATHVCAKERSGRPWCPNLGRRAADACLAWAPRLLGRARLSRQQSGRSVSGKTPAGQADCCIAP